MGNVFFVFDGCAQYLGSPSAPYLIAATYKRNNTPPPILVACIRNPVDQAISWWQYENNAMAWGESMGLKEWNTELRSKQYPPKTIADAFKYSQSSCVQYSYENAECFVKTKLKARGRILTLPPWAITWPGGQLSIFGKGYSCNIKRYNNAFQSEFGEPTNDMESTEDKVGWVHIAPLESQETGKQLKSLLRPILAAVVQRCVSRGNVSDTTSLMQHLDYSLERVCNGVTESIRRNSTPQTNQVFIANSRERTMMQDCFEKEINEMETMLCRLLAWR